MSVAIYADAGIIQDGVNFGSRSTIGGTWAFCVVDEDDNRVVENSGILYPPVGGTITNNQAEFYALLQALEVMPDGWSGFVCSDSGVTIGRMFQGWRTGNLPQDWVHRAAQARARLGRLFPQRLDGHPTVEHIAKGVGKRGGPVSRHNVWCDQRCTEIGRAHLEHLRRSATLR